MNPKWTLLVLGVLASACSSLPTPKYRDYSFPKEQAFIGRPTRPFQTLGLVRAKVNYQSLDPNREEEQLCKNYYNKAVRDLVRMAKKKGADAVVDVKTVVFLEDGRHDLYSTAECSDDGMEGQVLAQGTAVKWEPPKMEENLTSEGVANPPENSSNQIEAHPD